MATRCALLIGMCLLVPSIGLAQRTTTGSIAGKVVDANGGVLPGVNVSIKSDEALGLFSALTDARGEFRVSLLPEVFQSSLPCKESAAQ